MHGSLNQGSKWWTTGAVIVLLAAFAARISQLDRHPLWWDEGLNVYFAHQHPLSLLEETCITHDANPPVYRLAMGLWKTVVGSSAFTLRLLSTFLGMVTVALTWAAGCWLVSRKAALLAALFVALTPVHVHYSREVKGYAFATACAMVSTYAWGRRLGYSSSQFHSSQRETQRRREVETGRKNSEEEKRSSSYPYKGKHSDSHSRCWWATYILSTTAAIGAHYYLGLLVLWQGLWTVGKAGVALIRKHPTRQRSLKRLGMWALAAASVMLILAPWAIIVRESTVEMVTGVSVKDPLSIWGYLDQVGRTFGAGPGEEGPVASIASGLLAALLLIAILGTKASRTNNAFLLSWVLVPLMAAYPIQATFSFFSPRFLLYLVPPCYTLVSAGILTTATQIGQSKLHPLTEKSCSIRVKRSTGSPTWVDGRRLSAATAAVLVIAVLGLSIPGLDHIYTQPYISPDVGRLVEAEEPRPAIARIRARAHPDDALAYVYIWQVGYLYSYYPQNDLTFYRTYYTSENVDQEMQSIFASHHRLWLLSYRIAAEDRNNLPGSWLEAQAYKLESNWYRRHHVALYLAPDYQTPGVKPDRGIASFDERIELRYPLLNVQLNPGDVLALPLRWQALTTLNENYNVFVHLGSPGAPPLAQRDGPPRNGLKPTSAWAIGEEVVDRRALTIPDTLAPGRYQILVGLYRLSDGSRLPVSSEGGSDALPLGFVEVKR